MVAGPCCNKKKTKKTFSLTASTGKGIDTMGIVEKFTKHIQPVELPSGADSKLTPLWDECVQCICSQPNVNATAHFWPFSFSLFRGSWTSFAVLISCLCYVITFICAVSHSIWLVKVIRVKMSIFPMQTIWHHFQHKSKYFKHLQWCKKYSMSQIQNRIFNFRKKNDT